MDQPGWEGAHSSRPSRRIHHRRPPVEPVAADLLFDLELERRTVEDPAEGPVRGAEDAGTERVHGDARLECPCHVLVGVGIEVFAELHEEVDDLVDRHVERRPGLHPRPHQIVEIERRGEEAAVDRALVFGGHGHGAALDEVRNGLCHSW